MEFTIQIEPSKKLDEGYERAISSRLDVLYDDERPDLATVTAKLQKVVEKFNKEFKVVNFYEDCPMLFTKLVKVGIYVGVLDAKRYELFEYKYASHTRYDGEEPRIYRSEETMRTQLSSVRVVYDHEFASMTFDRKGIIETFTWSNSILFRQLNNKRREITKVLTYRIINALIRAWENEPRMSYHIFEDKQFDACIEYLVKFTEKPPLNDRDTVLMHWRYGFGYVKKEAWAQPVIEQVMSELEARP